MNEVGAALHVVAPEIDVDQPITLPEHRFVCEFLIKHGLTYGSVIPVEWLERVFGLSRSEKFMQFSMACYRLRVELEKHGFHMDGPGLNQPYASMLMAEDNSNVMESYDRQARTLMRRAVVLGVSTDLSKMDDEAKRKHEAVSEKLQMRYALMSRRNPAKVVESLGMEPKQLSNAAKCTE